MTDAKNPIQEGIRHPSDTYIIIDLEWNQPIPWIKSKVDPKTLPGEIIEIGAVKLTVGESGVALGGPFHMLIRPVCYTIMNKNVSRVIGKLSSDLRSGLGFIEAYDAFIQWCGEDFILCGWGNSDLSILKSNLRFHDRSAILGHPFLDVQMFFSKIAEGKANQRSVEYAVDFLKIPKRKEFHEAHRDAEYTGRILKALFEAIMSDHMHAVNPFPEDPAEPGKTADTEPIRPEIIDLERYLFDPDLNVHAERKTALFDTWDQCCRLTFDEDAYCPACGSKLIPELPWFRIRKAAFSLFRCERHNLVAGRIRMKKNASGKIYGSVILKLIQPGETVPILERFEEYKNFGPAGKPVSIPKGETIHPEN